MNKIILLSLSVGMIFLFTGCIKKVEPWEKGILGSENMQNNSGNSLASGYQEHIYYSKESSKGGSGVSGGGCGCN